MLGERADGEDFYANSAVAGSPWCTHARPATNGTVVTEVVPANPYNASADPGGDVVTTPPTSGSAGWNYDATNGKFWANSTDARTPGNDRGIHGADCPASSAIRAAAFTLVELVAVIAILAVLVVAVGSFGQQTGVVPWIAVARALARDLTHCA